MQFYGAVIEFMIKERVHNLFRKIAKEKKTKPSPNLNPQRKTNQYYYQRTEKMDKNKTNKQRKTLKKSQKKNADKRQERVRKIE